MAKHWEDSAWPKPWPQHKPRDLDYDWRNILPPAEPWMDQGSCVGRAPLWDRTIDGESEKAREKRRSEAARICRTQCPVLRECRDWADRTEVVTNLGVCAGRIPKAPTHRSTRRVWVDPLREGA